MNRIRNRKSSHSNPLSMFSAGVEQVIRDHQTSQIKDEDQEAREMERAPVKQTYSKNLFTTLLYKLC
jgi:hypothetical protein